MGGSFDPSRTKVPPGRLFRGAGAAHGPLHPALFILKAVMLFARILTQPRELNSEDVKVVALGISFLRFVGPLKL